MNEIPPYDGPFTETHKDLLRESKCPFCKSDLIAHRGELRCKQLLESEEADAFDESYDGCQFWAYVAYVVSWIGTNPWSMVIRPIKAKKV